MTRQPPRPPGPRTRLPLVLTARGSCASHPYPELWISSGRAQREAAAAVCATCAVAPECLRWAVRDLPATDTSVWAGTGPRERTALRRHHRRAQAALDQVLAA